MHRRHFGEKGAYHDFGRRLQIDCSHLTNDLSLKRERGKLTSELRYNSFGAPRSSAKHGMAALG
jgi:hypothetical protein